MSPSTPTDAAPARPDLHQAILEAEELESLLRDIAACGEITEIIPKFTATGHVPENAGLTMGAARHWLLHGEVRAVQFRYRYQGADWWDTVMVLPGRQFRLVRIQHHFDSPSA